MKLSKIALLIGGISLASLTNISYAKGIFSGDITIDGISKSLSYNTLEDAANAFDTGELEKTFGIKDLTGKKITGKVNLRGLETNFKVTDAKSTGEVITLDVPGVIDKTFTSNSSESADTQLKEWFKGHDGSDIDKLLKAFVSKTPFDPVGGNPVSLMSQITDHAFEIGDEAHALEPLSKNIGFFSIEPHYEQYSIGGNSVEMMALPITYTRYFRQGKTSMIVDLPIYVTKTDNSYTYSGMLGLGLKQYVNKHWALIPSFYAGGTGSIDLGSATLVYSGNLKSRLLFEPKNRWYVGVSNMVSYLWTQDLKVGDYNIQYGLKNWAFDNGTDLTYIFKNSSYALKTGYDFTVYTGSKWYIPHYSTVKLTLIKKQNRMNLLFNRFSLGASYVFGPHGFNGVNVQLGMMF